MSDKFKPRGTWREKLEKKQEPKIVDVPLDWQQRYGTGKMLVPTPLLIDDLMRKVPEGRLITVDQIRERLARDFNVGSTCPLTTGIFLRIAAETAEEDLQLGKKEVTPYWRVIRGDGSLNDKFPGGVEAQAARLREEGHTIEPGRGKKSLRVRDYEKRLGQL
ncbi:MAG: MGMT family protein [Dehalococcoidia bacterium]|nr:MGMT family protein [Dehalococcoidia bacterium]